MKYRVYTAMGVHTLADKQAPTLDAARRLLNSFFLDFPGATHGAIDEAPTNGDIGDRLEFWERIDSDQVQIQRFSYAMSKGVTA